ncbi:MAG TPA: SH3 domain-containing protein [bacterium]|nr:SH3 domain-containing protein [bacterium]
MNRKNIIILLVLLSLLPSSSAISAQALLPAAELCPCNGALSPCGQSCFPDGLPPMPAGPLLLTSDRPEHLSADYWINRLPNPDHVIKTQAEMEDFNRYIRSMVKDQRDIFDMGTTRSGSPVRSQIELEYGAVKNRLLFDVAGDRIPASLFTERIRPLIQPEKIPSQIKIRFAAAIRATSVRSLPTDVVMLEEIDDVEFNQLQFTLIKLWTPVAIYHTSSDGRWYYIQAPYTRGWVKARDIAVFSSREQLRKFAKPRDFLVVTGESIPVYHDPDFRAVNQQTSMGTILPLAGSTEGAYSVWMPVRGSDGGVIMKEGYVRLNADVSEGFLPYTQRNVLHQAFKLLGARYGWGGTYGGRDCSGFTQDVFLTVGMDMPRASKNQGYVGTQISHFDPYYHADAKTQFLREAIPGITLLRMSSHQMIYIGEENGKFYVIHSTWAERISYTSDEKRRINQVVVSDLSLNGDSYLGSLFDRMISMNELD